MYAGLLNKLFGWLTSEMRYKSINSSTAATSFFSNLCICFALNGLKEKLETEIRKVIELE